MGKYFIFKLIFSLLIVFFLLISCKTTEESVTNNEKAQKSDPTKYVIDKNNIQEDELKKNMKALFGLIEKYILKNDFDGWYNSLSNKYKDYLNDKNNLKWASESDFLSNREITLRSPKDYFEHIVVTSRDGKSLEFLDYNYINENTINVICLFDKKEKLIYKFVFEDGSWKLSL